MDYEKVFLFDMIGKRYDIGLKIGYIEVIIDFGLKCDDLKKDLKEILSNKI